MSRSNSSRRARRRQEFLRSRDTRNAWNWWLWHLGFYFDEFLGASDRQYHGLMIV